MEAQRVGKINPSVVLYLNSVDQRGTFKKKACFGGKSKRIILKAICLKKKNPVRDAVMLKISQKTMHRKMISLSIMLIAFGEFAAAWKKNRSMPFPDIRITGPDVFFSGFFALERDKLCSA